MVVYCENQTEHENKFVEKQLQNLMLRLLIQFPLGYKRLKGIRRKYLTGNVQCSIVWSLTDFRCSVLMLHCNYTYWKYAELIIVPIAREIWNRS